MANKKAIVEVEVTGAQAAIGAAERVGASWKKAGREIGGAFGKDLLDAGKRIVRDLASAANLMNSVSLADAARSYRTYQEQVARIGVVAKQSFGEMDAGIKRASERTLTPIAQVISWQKAVGGLTRDYGYAKGAYEALAKEAAEGNKSVDETQGLGDALYRVGVQAKDVGDYLGRARTLAGLLGNTGGPEAAKDRLQEVADVLADISGKSAIARQDMGRWSAGFGAGLSERQQRKVQQQALGFLEGNTRGIEQVLGHKIQRDEFGQVIDPLGVIGEYKQRLSKRFGEKGARRAFRNYGGDIFAATMMRYDFGELAKPEVAPTAPAALDTLRAGKPGQDIATDLREERNKLQIGAKVNDVTRDTRSFLSEHPWLQYALGAGGTAAAAKLVGSVAKGGLGALGRVAGAAGSVVSRALPVIGAGAAGYGVGTLADEAFGISDWISGTGRHSRVASDEPEMGRRAFAPGRHPLSELNPSRIGSAPQGALPGAASSTDQKLQQMIDTLIANGASPELAKASAKEIVEGMHSKPIRVILVGSAQPPPPQKGHPQ